MSAKPRDALGYARMGYPVIPCRPDPAPDGRSEDERAREAKRVDGARAPHGLRDATTDEPTIRRWFARPANLAILTPALAPEIDVPKEAERPGMTVAQRVQEARERYEYMAERFPEVAVAPLFRSRSGGYHSHLRPPADAPPLATGEWFGPDGEAWGHVRGYDNAYLLVPPSVAGGRAYTTVRPLVPFEALPLASAALWDAVRWKPERTDASEGVGSVDVLSLGDRREVGEPEAYARAILQGAHDRLAARSAGRHSATLDEARVLGRWIAGYARAGLPGLTVEDARDDLEAANTTNGYAEKVGMHDVRRTIRDGLRYGLARPFEVTTRAKRSQAPQPPHGPLRASSNSHTQEHDARKLARGVPNPKARAGIFDALRGRNE